MNSSTEIDALLSLLQYGVLGVLVLALLIGWVVPKHVNERDRSRADRLERDNAELRDRLEKDIIPLLTRAVLLLDRQAERHAGEV